MKLNLICGLHANVQFVPIYFNCSNCNTAGYVETPSEMVAIYRNSEKTYAVICPGCHAAVQIDSNQIPNEFIPYIRSQVIGFGCCTN